MCVGDDTYVSSLGNRPAAHPVAGFKFAVGNCLFRCAAARGGGARVLHGVPIQSDFRHVDMCLESWVDLRPRQREGAKVSLDQLPAGVPAAPRPRRRIHIVR